MQILHKENLHLGGFAGLKEHRFVVDRRVGGQNDTWDRLGNFIYLADAYFEPYGETRMHSHRELDVISVMIEGEIAHEGSLEHGSSVVQGEVQVQRAGGEGFRHNEINPHASKNRMIQLWVLPENAGERADYKHYTIEKNTLSKIYGGTKQQNITFDSQTIIEVGKFAHNEFITKDGEFLLYITQGTALVNESEVKDGDLIRGIDLDFKAQSENTQIILITQN
ncbi:Glutamate synthase [NADPH] large chain [hydrothermal vent metagenome]|uniref:Glutamate synthase [NADPH] large chain n=1 Tax=hydrothermal vent metagenome TaxID=652676 RepID=A0A1W1CT46_9ZZZZ